MYTLINSGLALKLNKVMADVSYIQKDKRNEKQGYNYASEAAIKAAFNGAFATHGIAFNFSTDGVQTDVYDVVNAAGVNRKVFQATVKATYKFIDQETGEYIEGYTVGIGQDSGDKAVYKAITGALKYALTSNFLVETGDDAEDDKDEPVYVPVDYKDKIKTKTVVKAPAPAPLAVPEKTVSKEPVYAAPTCMQCQVPLSENVATFSFQRYGNLLCFDHQQGENRKPYEEPTNEVAPTKGIPF